MAIKAKWRRELLPAEKRVDFKQLEEGWASAETALVDELIPVMVQVIDRLEKDLRAVLDSERYSELKDIRIGFKDKLVGIFKAHMFEAFKFGKRGVHQEFKIKKDLVLNASAREFMSVKAEAIVVSMLDKIKTNAILTALNGIKAGFTTDQIIAEVKGKTFKEQQAEAK
jgi:hypothetical protein